MYVPNRCLNSYIGLDGSAIGGVWPNGLEHDCYNYINLQYSVSYVIWIRDESKFVNNKAIAVLAIAHDQLRCE